MKNTTDASRAVACIRLVRLCDWCKHEGRETPAADPPGTHINGAYEEDFLCSACADWLDEGLTTIQEWGDGFAPIIEVKPNDKAERLPAKKL